MDVCQQAEERVPELILGLLEEPEKRQIEQHLVTCPHCAPLYQEFAILQLDGWREEKVPVRLRERTLTQVHAVFARESKPAERMGLGRLAIAVAGGIGSVLLYLAILWGHAGLSTLPSSRLLVVAAIWMGLMVAACCWALGHYRLRHWDLGAGALFGILTSGIAVAGVLLCPQETFFALWERSAVSQAITEVLGAGGNYALFGLIYALPVALLVAAGMGRSGKGWLATGISVILWLPAVYLQCSDLALSLILAWAGGALAGVLGGLWGGLWLRGLVLAAR